MKLKFWGVRGSIPSPTSSDVIAEKIIQAMTIAGENNIDFSNSDIVRAFVKTLPLEYSGTIGGNTTCITLETDDHLIIFDAGTGIRELGRYLMTREFGQGKGHAYIFLTHTHWDHVQGFPFFVPAFVAGNRFDIYHIHDHVPQVLVEQMTQPVFPADFKGLKATIEFHQLDVGQTITLADLEIGNMALDHPGRAYAYRISDPNHTIVIATDGEYKRLETPYIQAYLDFYQGADVLIFDAQFSMREAIIKEDWGHSSALIGADVARLAQVKRLILFHHDPTAPDEEIINTKIQAHEYLAQQDKGHIVQVQIAREGWEIDFDETKNFTIAKMDITSADILCLALSGQFDFNAVEAFNDYIADVEQSENIQTIILDLSNLQEITMGGVRALLDARYYVNAFILANVPDHIQQVMRWANVTDFFAIYDSLDQALNPSSVLHK